MNGSVDVDTVVFSVTVDWLVDGIFVVVKDSVVLNPVVVSVELVGQIRQIVDCDVD